MGRRKHILRQTSADEDDLPDEVQTNSRRAVSPTLVLAELDEEFDEDSHDGALTIGDGCFLTQHPSGYGPDF